MALSDQMIRAARLDIALYEEVEADTSQTASALTVVVLASLASGVGSAIAQAMSGQDTGGAGVILALFGGVVAAIASWAVWTGCVYFIGTRLFGGTATWGEVLRTVGFANAPGVLNVLGFVPVLGGLVRLAVLVWVIVATVIAVRQALDVGTGRAIVASIVGAILAAIISVLIALIFAIPSALMGAMG